MVHASTDVLQRLLEKQKRQILHAQKDAFDTFQPNTVVDTDRFLGQLNGKVKSSGRANLERFKAAFKHLETKCGYSLGFLQHQLMDIATLILIPRMFGNQLERELHYLKVELGLKHLFEQAAVTLPRRSGKTVVQTILAALVAVTQPDGIRTCIGPGLACY